MLTWLNLLPLEIQGIEELLEPIDEVKEGETIVGVISDDLKRLWTLFKSIRKSADLLSIEVKYRQASAQETGKISELLSKARALELIFWIGVIDEFQIWGHAETPGLRRGWQVVEYKQPTASFLGFMPWNQQ